MRKLRKSTVGAAALAAAALTLGVTTSASADIYPGPNDVVGGGSDTTQYATDFIMDGTTAGLPGYNSGKTNRVFSFDATADANGRGVFNDAGVSFAPTAVLRSGTAPVIRPNGSGAGIKSLYQAPYIAPGPVVNFARASRLPTCQENADAATAGFGGLHVYRFAKDDLAIAAVPGTTHAPAGLSPAELVKIYDGTYRTWGDIPGYSGAFGSSTIIPLLPQPNSGTRGSWDADMKAANGNVAVTYSNPNIIVTQESDYTGFSVATTSSPNDTIGPFSSGRIALNNSGFFGAAAQNQVVLRIGATPGGAAAYDDQRAMYFVVRESDVNSSTIFQPGGSKNFVKTLFAGGAGSVVGSPAFAANISAAGFTTGNYADLGFGVSGTSCT